MADFLLYGMKKCAGRDEEKKFSRFSTSFPFGDITQLLSTPCLSSCSQKRGRTLCGGSGINEAHFSPLFFTPLSFLS